MNLHLSTLGTAHTIIGIVAIIFAIVALLLEGKINPKSTAGKWYILLTIIASLTSFGIRKTGHFSPAHFLTLLILIILPIAVFATSIRAFGKRAVYIQIVGMTITLFLSLIPTFVETLTRVPVSHPLAASQDAPLLKVTLGILALVFGAGIFYQLRKLRASLKEG